MERSDCLHLQRSFAPLGPDGPIRWRCMDCLTVGEAATWREFDAQAPTPAQVAARAAELRKERRG